MKTGLLVLVVGISFCVGAEPAFDPAAAKNSLRALHAQLTAATTPDQKEAIGKQMLALTTPLVKAEPDGLGGWLLHGEAAVATKQGAAGTEASAQLQKLHADKSGNPLAATVLAQLKAMSAEPAVETETAAGALKERLKELPNGDHVLTGLPTIEDKAKYEWADMHSFVWLQRYFGWKTDVEELLKKKKQDVTDDKFDPYKFLTGALDKVAHVRVKTSVKFDRRTVMREIEHGRPVMVWRTATETRDGALLAFAKKFASDPSAKLPDPRNPAEKKNWPVWSKKAEEKQECFCDVSIVYGFNEKRGEFIYLDSASGPEFDHMRITSGEMEFTTTDVFLFD